MKSEREEEYVLGSRIIKRFYGDEKFPVKWESEEEKRLHWWFDDLHCPHPLSWMYVDIGKWWGENVDYALRRFKFPQSKSWPGKIVNRYLYSALVPRDPEEARRCEAYYNMVFPVYIKKFPEWWRTRYEPELRRNLEYLDNYDYASADLPELMVLLEDALDISNRNWQIHWILNFAQFFSFIRFRQVYAEVFGGITPEDNEEIEKILTSFEDKNWEAIKELWLLKERVKGSARLSEIFGKGTAKEVYEALQRDQEGRGFIKELERFLKGYGAKAIYAHEYIYPTWREDPTPVIELIRTYLVTNYNYFEHFYRLKKVQEEAISRVLSRVKDEEKRKKLEEAMNDALLMAPLTPNHHFYIDQGTNARVRLVLIEIGKRLVERGVLEDPNDVMLLHYEELRDISADHRAFDAKRLVSERKREMEEAKRLVPPHFLGTVTEWSAREEAWKVGVWGWRMPEEAEVVVKNIVRGMGASPGVAEGTARVVTSIEEFDQVQSGDILVCDMTNPGWAPLFPKIKGIVTDSGGLLSHPAILAREFRIPAVVGTREATRRIKSGQRIRVDGGRGVVEILK